MTSTTSKPSGASATLSEPTISHSDGPTSARKKCKQNWRINLLAHAKWPGNKYQKPSEVFDSGVAPGALSVEIASRVEHMSRPPIRRLVVNKNQFSKLPTTFPDYEQRIDRRIATTWDSIYNYYRKQQRELAQKSSKLSTASKRSKQSKSSKGSKDSKGKGGKADKGKKGKKGKGGGDKREKGKGKKGAKRESDSKSEEEIIEKRRTEWVNLRAMPKQVHKPEPISRGPIADMDVIKSRMEEMATPRTSVKKFTETEVETVPKIAQAALAYEATERVLELAKPAAFRLVKDIPIIPGAVSRGALLAIPTPRVLVLATPKTKQNAREADLKDDPFAISANALKYVATPRILELAKPIDRK